MQYFPLLLTGSFYKKSTVPPPWNELLGIFVKIFLQLLQLQICRPKNIS